MRRYSGRRVPSPERRPRIRTALGAGLGLAAAAAVVGGPLATPAAAAPCRGGVLNVVAHQDDDLIFLNPDILHDVRAGLCVRTVFVTAGDAGNPYPDSILRERAPQAAYARMAGVSNDWQVETDDGVPGRTIRTQTLVGAPNVSIAFLRIPDGFPSGQGSGAYGGQSLAKLWTGSVSSVSSVDQANTYTRSGLIDALAAMMTDLQPDTIRTMDYVSPITDADHSDHFMTALFTQAAEEQFNGAPHTLVSYLGYAVGGRAQNVFDPDLTDKLGALEAASAFDSGAADPWVRDLARRSYVLDTHTGGSDGQNHAPVAAAGADLTVQPGAVVQLDGTASRDPDGDPLTYSWTQTSGPSVALSSTTDPRPTFTAPGAGVTVGFSLVVSDGSLSSAPDDVLVTTPAPPPAGSVNLARTGPATVTASTQNLGDGQTALKAIDGSPLGYPADYSREWVTTREGVGAWIQLAWGTPVTLDHVVLFDRPNASDQITSGTLTFSDGSTAAVGTLTNDGAAVTVSFTPRTVSSVRLTVTGVRPGGSNAGLAEFEAWGSAG